MPVSRAPHTRQLILAYARAVVTAAAGRKPLPLPPAEPAFREHAGAFVSLHLGGELRGCIGHIGADQSLGDVLQRCAAAAAMDDPRFDPVRPDEVVALVVEVSILSAIEPVSELDAITVGRHGLIVEQGWRKGLLLPQVAVEHRWTRQVFLEQTCRKAGLPADAWREGATVSWFEADVFGEQPCSP